MHEYREKINFMNKTEIQKLLTHTKSLMNHIYLVKQEFGLKPKKEHHGSSINYTDILERRDDFKTELVNTIVDWVYSKTKAKAIIDDRFAQTKSEANASAFLATRAFCKFRHARTQGQFGELLLFNLIQYCFEAVPLLRKMRITTSTGLERFGADAMHYKVENGNNVFILGESKCYTSKYNFKNAFTESLISIENTFKNIGKELDLYVYDDFIEDELIDIAVKFKSNQLSDVRFELVCLVIYNETTKITKDNEDQIKKHIVSTIRDKCVSLDAGVFAKIDRNILNRINYIIFPVWELDKLVKEFGNSIGK